jgi:hypothetical protein
VTSIYRHAGTEFVIAGVPYEGITEIAYSEVKPPPKSRSSSAPNAQRARGDQPPRCVRCMQSIPRTPRTYSMGPENAGGRRISREVES